MAEEDRQGESEDRIQTGELANFAAQNPRRTLEVLALYSALAGQAVLERGAEPRIEETHLRNSKDQKPLVDAFREKLVATLVEATAVDADYKGKKAWGSHIQALLTAVEANDTKVLRAYAGNNNFPYTVQAANYLNAYEAAQKLAA